MEHICNARIPPIVMDSVPPYYTFGTGPKFATLLWDIVSMIEGKQREAAALVVKK